VVVRNDGAIEGSVRRTGLGTAARPSAPGAPVVVAPAEAGHQSLPVDRVGHVGAQNGRTIVPGVRATEAAARASDLAGLRESTWIDRLDLDPVHRPIEAHRPGAATAARPLTGRGSTGPGKVATAGRLELETLPAAAIRGARRTGPVEDRLPGRIGPRSGSTRTGLPARSRPIVRHAASGTRYPPTAFSPTAPQESSGRRDRPGASGRTAPLAGSRRREHLGGSPGTEHLADSNRAGRPDPNPARLRRRSSPVPIWASCYEMTRSWSRAGGPLKRPSSPIARHSGFSWCPSGGRPSRS
jgi:hypothetical protein